MKRDKRLFSQLFFVPTMLLVLLAACASEPKELPEDIAPIEYFQKAQQVASDDGNYSLAIRYYRSFMERYPEETQRIIEAKYEIAFLHYKQGKLDIAEEEFESLLKTYEEGDNASVLPSWPRVLAQKVLKKIKEKQADDQDSRQVSEASGQNQE